MKFCKWVYRIAGIHGSLVLVLGLIDLLLGALFIGAYVTTTQTRVLVIHDPDRSIQ